MASRIIDNLYLGDVYDGMNARQNGFDVVINVLETKWPDEHFAGEINIPVAREVAKDEMRAYPVQLDKVANLTDRFLRQGKKVLIRCAAGQERSPLTVMWFLHKKRGMTMEQAYQFVKSRRDEAQDRRYWLPRPRTLADWFHWH